jgi:hypothetical protein
MDPHRLAEARSLAYHEIVARRIADEPAILQRARERVAAWFRQVPPPHHAMAWADKLSGTRASLPEFLVDPGEHARELRQSTPFAGALDPRERWRLWREVADRCREVA